MDPAVLMHPMGGHLVPMAGHNQMPPGAGAGFNTAAMPHVPHHVPHVGHGGFHAEKAFPAVRLRGLPFNALEFDVLDFFQGLEVVDVLIVRRDNRTTGEAYVLFGNASQLDFALQKNRAPMGRRYIEVFRAKKQEYYAAVANLVSEQGLTHGGGGFGNEANGLASGMASNQSNGYHQFGEMTGAPGAPNGGVQMNGAAPPLPHGPPGSVQTRNGVGGFKQQTQVSQPPPPSSAPVPAEHTGVLKLRGLPFAATKDDIVGFFGGSITDLPPLAHDSIHIVTSMDGRPSGVAFVEFNSPEDARAAHQQMDRQSMGTRYVELFASSREEATRAATGGR